jgi:hypothetical protein
MRVDIGAFEFQLSPMPSLALISPRKVAAGDTSNISLVVESSGFDIQSVVDWNATALATTFVSTSALTAMIPTSDFASPGDDTITVINPSPGGGTSTAATFRRVKKETQRILHPITNFTVSYVAAVDAVEITLGTTEPFPTRGQITVLSGLTTASGGTLTGNAVFAISKKGKSIGPA